ncbi:hypothetical protein HYDPIDRAFT_156204 [Hydnomerulius pinastri MD-312]|uniref:Unplaced genomic scaffold scaffold_17, whole genome shotgun sequence n=1 Tax=Hydnomerulius pinastri MD-312 TaxID=994086 RepID=A0A0C9WDU8_9AGAM|nr:hypothetical protein HYDPIDRAFT_156204 [Hydnomerulius pinastri MD-312]
MSESARHDRFYMPTITLLVENYLFRVPRLPFETQSEVFSDMLLLPTSSNVEVEGQSDNNPIKLEGIKKNDFEQLLKILFPIADGKLKQLPVGPTEWTSALKLSLLWEFTSIRDQSLVELRTLLEDPIDRILLAKEFDIEGEWLLEAMNELARRPKPLGMEDVERLGVEFVIQMAAVRESFVVEIESRIQVVRESATVRLADGQRPKQTLTYDFQPAIRRIFNVQ